MTDQIWIIVLMVAVSLAFLGGLEVGLRAFGPIQIVVHEADEQNVSEEK